MRLLACVLVVVAVWSSTLPAVSADESALAVIVHPSRATSLTREAVRRIYLKGQRFWDDGHEIVVINQAGATAARQTFTRVVFGDEAARLPAYWNQEYFQGVLPPIILGSEEAVVRYVASRP